MSNSKKRPHGTDHHAAGHDGAKQKTSIHHDWRFRTAVVLMLLAMGAYVLTLDESLEPGEVDEPVVPMVAE